MSRLFNGTTDQGQVALNLSSFAQLSMSFWLWQDVFSNGNGVAMEFGTTTLVAGGFGVAPNNSTGSNFGVIMSTGSVFWLDNFPRPSAGKWHHYLWTANRATPVNVVYVDGVLQTLTGTNHGAGTYGNFGNLTLNLMSRNAASLFNAGRLAEIAIWGGVLLGQTDATNLFNKQLPTFDHPSSLSDYWPLAGQTSPEPEVSAGGTGITMTGTKSALSPIYTNLGLPPAFPPIVRGHPAMSRSRVFFPSRQEDAVTVAIAGTSSLTATVTPSAVFTISIGGTSALTAAIAPLHRITATLAGTSTLSAIVAPTQRFTVTIAGSSTLAASATPYQRIVATLVGTSSLAATATPYQRLTVSLAGTSSLAASIVRYQRITPTLAGTSALASAVTPYQTITPTLAGHGALTATVTAYQGIAVTLAGTSALTAGLSAYVPLNPTLAGTSTLAGTLTPIGPVTPTSSGLAGQRQRVRIDPRVRRDDELLILLSTVL